jgi:hypothetical protein
MLARANRHRVSQATKEWKGSSTTSANVVLAIKEWKVVLTPTTKEW